MSWFHGGSIEDVKQARSLGHFPAAYAPQQANWGSGVYLTADRQEAKQYGSVAVEVFLPGDLKLLDMRNPEYRAMPSTVFDRLKKPRAKAAFQKHWDKGNIREAVRAGVLADGFAGVMWTGDASSVRTPEGLVVFNAR